MERHFRRDSSPSVDVVHRSATATTRKVSLSLLSSDADAAAEVVAVAVAAWQQYRPPLQLLGGRRMMLIISQRICCVASSSLSQLCSYDEVIPPTTCSYFYDIIL